MVYWNKMSCRQGQAARRNRFNVVSRTQIMKNDAIFLYFHGNVLSTYQVPDGKAAF